MLKNLKQFSISKKDQRSVNGGGEGEWTCVRVSGHFEDSEGEISWVEECTIHAEGYVIGQYRRTVFGR